MDTLKKLSKKLWIKALAVVLIIMASVGATMAWLSSSSPIAGGPARMGDVWVNAYVYDLKDIGDGEEPKIRVPGFNRGDGFSFDESDPPEHNAARTRPVIYEERWEPNRYSAKLIKIANDGAMTARVKLFFDVLDEGLGEALWYALVPVEPNGDKLDPPSGYDYKTAARPMYSLQADTDGLGVFKLKPGESRQFLLVYSMCAWAGNAYQTKGFAADISLIATQDTDAAEYEILH